MFKKMIPLLLALLLFITACTACANLTNRSDTFTYPIESFVVVGNYLDDNQVGHGSGSVIRQTEKGTIILTAEHVCDNPELQVVAAIHNKTPSVRVNELKSYVLHTDREEDLCMMKVPNGLEHYPVLPLSQTPPELQEKVFTTSSPRGLADLENNLVGMFEGLYLGETEVLGIMKSAFSIPTAGGSSGSPIFNMNGEIVSITTHGNRGFENVGYGPKWEVLHEFITDYLQLR